jgi:integrase
MKFRIEKQAQRDRLPMRHEPFWHSLGDRRAVGYRNDKKKGSTGHWIARWREEGAHGIAGKKHFEPLKEARDFDEACAAATEWFKKISAGNVRKITRGTVNDALAAYVKHLRTIGRARTADEVEARFKLTVGDKPFGRQKLEAVTRQDVEHWRDGLRKGREPRSVNRQARALIAGLNHAVLQADYTGNVKAWALTHLVDEGEEHSAVFLTAAQRDRLIKYAPSPAAGAMMTAYAHLACRPAELEKAVVADFDPIGGSVTLKHRKGKGAVLRTRAVPLDDAGHVFFTTQCKGKTPLAPLVSDPSGKPWTKKQRTIAMRAAIEAADAAAESPEQRLPEGVVTYSFRHSKISQWLQVDEIGELSVAKAAGTSIAMLERTYFRFIGSAMKAKLNAGKNTAKTA